MRYVPPEALWTVWPRVRAIVERIGPRLGPAKVEPEELYHALRAQQAALHVVGEGDHIDGIVVCQKILAPGGEPILFVWLAGGDLREHRAQCEEALESMARQVGARRIQMRSARAGWQRGMRDWWRAVDTTYEHEVRG